MRRIRRHCVHVVAAVAVASPVSTLAHGPVAAHFPHHVTCFKAPCPGAFQGGHR